MYDIRNLFTDETSAPVLIVAEIGINHLGDINFAKELIDSAVDSGADALKFQVYDTDNFYNRKIKPGAYDLFKSFELSYDNFLALKEYTEKKDKIFFATPLDIGSMDFLTDIKTPLLKIASSDLTTEPFLEKAGNSGLPVIISSGFAGVSDVKKALSLLDKKNSAVLYCVSKYPPENRDMDLNIIPKWKDELSVPIGFSDHTQDIYLSAASVALGAKIIERHFTTDNTIKGADHSMSLNPEKFSSMVAAVRQIEAALGNGVKQVTDFENEIRYPSMRAVYAGKEIKKGHIIQEKDLVLLRPGNGVNLKNYRAIIGKKARKDFGLYENI